MLARLVRMRNAALESVRGNEIGSAPARTEAVYSAGSTGWNASRSGSFGVSACAVQELITAVPMIAAVALMVQKDDCVGISRCDARSNAEINSMGTRTAASPAPTRQRPMKVVLPRRDGPPARR